MINDCSSTYDGLSVYADQHREKPRGVPNIHGKQHPSLNNTSF